MAWILYKKAHVAVNFDHVVRINYTDDNLEFGKYNPKTWIVYAVSTNDDYIYLTSFDTREEAEQYVFDIVRWIEFGIRPNKEARK